MTNDRAKDLALGYRVTVLGAVASVILAGLKLWAGIFAHSQALIADSIHSLGDLSTDIVTLFGLKHSMKSPDLEHPFGHGKVASLTTLVLGGALFATGIFIGVKAALGILHKELASPGRVAVVVAALSVVVKEVLYQVTISAGREMENEILVTNAWHHRSDALSSVAVLAGVFAAWMKPSWRFMDAYAAMGVSFFILKVAIDFSRGAVRDLMDTAPPEEMRRLLYEEALKVEGVEGVHDFKSRTLGNHIHVSMHLEVDPTITVLEAHQISKRVERALREMVPELGEVAIQVNPCGLCPLREECHPKPKPF